MRIKPLNFIVEAIVCNFISKQIILINGPIRRRYNSWKALSSETTRPGRILALGCQLPRWYRVRWYFDHDFLPLEHVVKPCNTWQKLIHYFCALTEEPWILIKLAITNLTYLLTLIKSRFQENDTFVNKQFILWNKNI